MIQKDGFSEGGACGSGDGGVAIERSRTVVDPFLVGGLTLRWPPGHAVEITRGIWLIEDGWKKRQGILYPFQNVVIIDGVVVWFFICHSRRIKNWLRRRVGEQVMVFYHLI